jgi:hypothetical protein
VKSQGPTPITPIADSQHHERTSDPLQIYLRAENPPREGGDREEAGLTLTVKSWTEVADDAAAMLKRTTSGGCVDRSESKSKKAAGVGRDDGTSPEDLYGRAHGRWGLCIDDGEV